MTDQAVDMTHVSITDTDSSDSTNKTSDGTASERSNTTPIVQSVPISEPQNSISSELLTISTSDSVTDMTEQTLGQSMHSDDSVSASLTSAPADQHMTHLTDSAVAHIADKQTFRFTPNSRPLIEHQCLSCDQTFMSKSFNRRFCCRSCAIRFSNQHRQSTALSSTRLLKHQSSNRSAERKKRSHDIMTNLWSLNRQHMLNRQRAYHTDNPSANKLNATKRTQRWKDNLSVAMKKQWQLHPNRNSGVMRASRLEQWVRARLVRTSSPKVIQDSDIPTVNTTPSNMLSSRKTSSLEFVYAKNRDTDVIRNKQVGDFVFDLYLPSYSALIMMGNTMKEGWSCYTKEADFSLTEIAFMKELQARKELCEQRGYDLLIVLDTDWRRAVELGDLWKIARRPRGLEIDVNKAGELFGAVSFIK